MHYEQEKINTECSNWMTQLKPMSYKNLVKIEYASMISWLDYSKSTI